LTFTTDALTLGFFIDLLAFEVITGTDVTRDTDFPLTVGIKLINFAVTVVIKAIRTGLFAVFFFGGTWTTIAPIRFVEFLRFACLHTICAAIWAGFELTCPRLSRNLTLFTGDRGTDAVRTCTTKTLVVAFAILGTGALVWVDALRTNITNTRRLLTTSLCEAQEQKET
tara:strand:- start:239 stop:745 length:507 start_codon:yes stop_codon:yes gene_type:complete